MGCREANLVRREQRELGSVLEVDAAAFDKEVRQMTFQEFYSTYPRRIARKDAERAWAKLSPEEKNPRGRIFAVPPFLLEGDRNRAAVHPLPCIVAEWAPFRGRA